MRTMGRGLCVFILLLPLSCAGPLEEAGGFQPALSSTPAAPPSNLVARDSGVPPVELSREQLRDTLRILAPQLERVMADPTLSERLLLAEETAVLRRWGPTRGLLVLANAEKTDELDREILRRYSKHCEELHAQGDCLGALDGRAVLTPKARYKIACHFALAAVWDGIKDELHDMTDLQRIERTIVTAVVVYLALVSVPEPTSKILAAALTAAMVAWLGVETLENVIGGWVDMVRAANRALTFDELRSAGEEYGRRVGEQALRIVVMLIASAISEQGLANLPKLPRFELASRRLATATGGPGLNIVPEVRQVTVTPGRVTLVLAKAAKASQATTLAMAASRNGGRTPCFEQTHHIATVENSKATWNGGPWTPRFEKLFAQVGLSMENVANKVRVWGHQGPHPEQYHQVVYQQLKNVLDSCGSGDICRSAFIRELEHLGQEITTPGTNLNDLVTKGCGKRN